MGVREKLTSIDTRIATVAVTPNCKSMRPATLERNDTGRNTITSERVVTSTARPISLVPTTAACMGGIPFSSMAWNTFSSTTMASSITTPTMSTSANMVTLFSVKSKARIMANVAMIEAGMATAAISVERQDFMNTSTTRVAKMLPTTRCFWTSCMAALM